ncbi:MAG: PrsW family intramembrane metalloprotease [Candidatus Heimdallarchaeota archaeon]|nr:PrsW family intramembrane metalloprotease [Candidatus Heimdallarchaeota archaeon]
MLDLLIILTNFIIIALVWKIFYSKFVIIKDISYLFLPIILGVLSIVIVTAISYFLLPAVEASFPEVFSLIVFYVLLAPFVEEWFKTYMIKIVNDYRRFQSVAEGAFVGSLIGLIFAGLENIIFTLQYAWNETIGLTIMLLIIRGTMVIFGHPLFSLINGTAIAINNLDKGFTTRKDFIRSVVFHMMWNFFVLLPVLMGFSSLLLRIFIMVVVSSILMSVVLKERNYVYRLESLRGAQ